VGALAPHEYQALAGATILVNISASNEILAKADWRRIMMYRNPAVAPLHSVMCPRAQGNHPTTSFSAGIPLSLNGTVLKESQRLLTDQPLIIADIDVDRLAHDRLVLNSFRQSPAHIKPFRVFEANAAIPPLQYFTAISIRNRSYRATPAGVPSAATIFSQCRWLHWRQS